MIENLTTGDIFTIKEYNQKWEVKAAVWHEEEDRVIITFQITEGPGKNSQFTYDQDKFLEYINQ